MKTFCSKGSPALQTVLNSLLSICLMGCFAMSTAWAQVSVSGAWARPIVAGQKATGAFMTITSAKPLSLVRVSSPLAGVAQLHSMSMEGNTMKMAPVAEMKLEPQVPLQLAPGGYHLMLMDLKPEFAKATSVPLTLTFKDMKGEEVQKEVEVPITMNPPQAPNAAPEHMHMHM
jgi:periplasmic copper chaperone A